MRYLRITFVVLFTFILPDYAYAISIRSAIIDQGKVIVIGRGAERDAEILWDGKFITKADGFGRFKFVMDNLPDDCTGVVSDGTTEEKIVIKYCGHKGAKGEMGEKGDRGSKGEKGNPGKSVSRYEKVDHNCPGSICIVHCSRGKKVIGGGCSIDQAYDSRLINSYTPDGFSWKCEYSSNENTIPQTTISTALCAMIEK